MEEMPVSGATEEMAVICMAAILWFDHDFGKRQPALAVISNWHNVHLVIPNYRHGPETTGILCTRGRAGQFYPRRHCAGRGPTRPEPPGAPAGGGAAAKPVDRNGRGASANP